ncbi:hypothetical protein BKK79_27650 [Cupriavidus sp. USMAA2-4]|uniref:flagellar basal body-associated FliL family protein n=1 Tax=Cupriavidus sp. USMAA2-4 TaxID=876364 RepID=UPI0008A68301|nr:flagellar basal body-associated FliL family protein [Cupriavidus sp. USMAA2-4]AOY95528.1 hypothetical protein BKK79_27650 [Cupriavidus sp. USMAA2-4]
MSKAATLQSKPTSAAPGAGKTGTRLLLAVLAVLLVVAAAGAGYWWWGLRGKAAGAAPAPAAAPAYLPLDPLVVNLSDDGSAAHLLRIAITLKLAGPDAKEALTARMPEIRDRVLNTLASQHADRIVSAEGKAALREALLAQVAAVAKGSRADGQVGEVLFTEFVVQ